jgi:hypothetical protein
MKVVGCLLNLRIGDAASDFLLQGSISAWPRFFVEEQS